MSDQGNTHKFYAISPVDGRYSDITTGLSKYFSEFAWYQARVRVEIDYFIALSNKGLEGLTFLSEDTCKALLSIAINFSEDDLIRIKEIERTTKHDIKAIEYFIASKFDGIEQCNSKKSFIHFGLTSQDINNVAFPILLRDAYQHEVREVAREVYKKIDYLSHAHSDVAMMAHTHGQPAIATTLGKEFSVFRTRLWKQLKAIDDIPFYAKFGGAVGGMDAHLAAYPKGKWKRFAEDFVESYGLKRSYPTTQIEHYDFLAAQLQGLSRVATILIDLVQDIWLYRIEGVYIF